MSWKTPQFTLAAAAAFLVEMYRERSEHMLCDIWRNRRAVWVCPDAPETYDQLCDLFFDHKVLVISNQHCDSSIYGQEGNLLFRIHHDLMHLEDDTRDFSTNGELATIAAAWGDLKLSRVWSAACAEYDQAWLDFVYNVYLADTVGQTLYYHRYARFPKNQTDFVRQTLVSGSYQLFNNGVYQPCKKSP